MKKLQSSCTSAFTVFEIDSLLWTYTGSEKKNNDLHLYFLQQMVVSSPLTIEIETELNAIHKTFLFLPNSSPSMPFRSPFRSGILDHEC
jgi:hypothetical protein